MRARIKRVAARIASPANAAITAGVAAVAAALWLVCGVGFANYDTLYALAWGGQLARGETPAYEVAIAPTPHPLVEALGVVLSPLPARAIEDLAVALGFLALAGCAWVLYRLTALWFGRAAGVVAALVLLTRVPILSYGVRAYVDIPYLLFVLAAVLVQARRHARGGRPAGAPVLALLALAGLLRPEAWAFSGLYWLYLLLDARRARGGEDEPRSLRELAGLALLAASAPLVWILSDLAITGDPLWSLTNTRHTAHALDRVTGIANVPEYVPRRIGEILRVPVLVGAVFGGLLALLTLRRRALAAVIVGALALAAFVVVGAAGLSINTRYAFLTAAVLCMFCGAAAFGWTRLPADHPRRPVWIAIGLLLLAALLAFTPAQVKSAHREMDKLARQQTIQDELIALVEDGSVNLRCGPVGVPNHAPVPLLALYLKASPAEVPSAQVGAISAGQYVDPASKEVEEDYVLDPHDPHRPVNVPPGFMEAHANHTWLIFQRCA